MSGLFRENLRNELKFRGVTVKELSANTNIPVATLDCYLGARASMPSVDAAVRIARFLGVSVEYLVNGESPALPDSVTQDCFLIKQIEDLNPKRKKIITDLIREFAC